ncbi:hypothetical protein LY78DRAFT_643605 [Colletotrichum sublineola]|nr:hypothetical protein LY78DRAFT_643605 [Colletotrichum sublineola]
MLPPVEQSVLRNNPEFAELHHALTTAILNPDGTTKKPATKEQTSAQNELADHRFKAAKEHLLINAISKTAPPEPKAAPARTIARSKSASQPALAPQPQPQQQQQLPDSLLDLLLLLPPLLTPTTEPLHADSLAILLSNPPFTEFPSLLPQLGELVSATLHSSAVALARIASPTTNPSFLHRNVPALQTTYQRLESDLREAKYALARERLRAADSLTAVLDKHAGALTLLVRALEAKHGVVARSLEFRAAEAGLEAQRAEADAVAAREGVRKEVYSPEMVAALSNYAAHLRDARMRLESVVTTLRAELEAYGVAVGDDGAGGDGGKERVLREMARKKRQLEKELEDAKRDLARLDKA